MVLFDPDNPTAKPALNVLAGPDPHTVTDNLVGIFRRIYTDYWGPRTDDILRAACLTLRANTNTAQAATLADIPDLLTNSTRRTELTTGLDDPVLAGFWEWYHALSEPARAIAPLMNKLRAFLLRTFVRDTLCAQADSVDLGRLLDTGGICLVRVPKGSLGTDTARLFGSLVQQTIKQGAPLPTADQVRTHLQTGYSPLDRSTVGQWLDEWLPTKRKIKKNTRRSYESHIRLYLKPHLGHHRLDRLTVAHIQEMFDAIEEYNDLIR
ncbi:hypothetical protein [Actinokineospora sp.]|uniref:hypothetical protein n=1 Tax=Actinokineospora sp. TaxID=1872133 RepID=UPI003D6AC181